MNEHEMNCVQCGAVVDRRDLTQVLVHEHNGPVPVMNYGGGVCIRKAGESAEDATRRLGGDVGRLETALEAAESALRGCQKTLEKMREWVNDHGCSCDECLCSGCGSVHNPCPRDAVRNSIEAALAAAAKALGEG